MSLSCPMLHPQLVTSLLTGRWPTRTNTKGAGQPHGSPAQPPCLQPCCGKTRQSKRPQSIIIEHSRINGNLVSSLFIYLLSPIDLQILFLMLKSSSFNMYQTSFMPQNRTNSSCCLVRIPAIFPSKLVSHKHDIPGEVIYFTPKFALSNVRSLSCLRSSLLERLCYFLPFSSNLSCLFSSSNSLTSNSKSGSLFCMDLHLSLFLGTEVGTWPR